MWLVIHRLRFSSWHHGPSAVTQRVPQAALLQSDIESMRSSLHVAGVFGNGVPVPTAGQRIPKTGVTLSTPRTPGEV